MIPLPPNRVRTRAISRSAWRKRYAFTAFDTRLTRVRASGMNVMTGLLGCGPSPSQTVPVLGLLSTTSASEQVAATLSEAWPTTAMVMTAGCGASHNRNRTIHLAYQKKTSTVAKVSHNGRADPLRWSRMLAVPRVTSCLTQPMEDLNRGLD